MRAGSDCYQTVYKPFIIVMLASLIKKKNKILVDQTKPVAPYFLKAEDHFIAHQTGELFIKKIFSVSPDRPQRGCVILAPGLATNANIYRIDDEGRTLTLDHNRSFANFLAAEGYDVYLYQPGYAERIFNRYVARHCKESQFFKKPYIFPSDLSFSELVDREIPLLIEYVTKESKTCTISWIGYSLGGMLIYSYLSKNEAPCIINVISIGSPITLNQVFIRIIPYANIASKALGFEEKTLVGAISENFVPFTRFFRIFPGWLLRYNLLTILFCNPFNIKPKVLKAFFGKAMEPIPAALEESISAMISEGKQKSGYSPNLIASLREIQKKNVNFLFFYGTNDMLAPADSVFLAHEIISPNNSSNLGEVKTAGHLDLIIGKNARKEVWEPAVAWLKERT